MRVASTIRGVMGIAVWACLAVIACRVPAQALEIVLNDVAADRVERQRHFVRNELPLPGTPDLASLDERLKAAGTARGRAIYVRIFKAESELEIWMQNTAGTFSRLAVYPVCHWTGTIGPKLEEGDKQSPEGFYSVGVRQTRLVGRWRRAFNVGFPNLHDQLLHRTGSYILIHGGCSSVGCFAMTDPVQEEIYALAAAALAGGQERFQVHIFPFRMTAENVSHYADHEWAHTWADLKPAYDSFERTHVPPRVALCGVRYKIADGLPGETGDNGPRLTLLKPIATAAAGADQSAVLDSAGNWIEPQCQLDDEALRRATYAIASSPTKPLVIESSAAPVDATPIAGAAALDEPPPSDSLVPDAAAALHTNAAVEPTAAAAPGPSPAAGHPLLRPHKTSKAGRRAQPGETSPAAMPLGEGFGSATFRANKVTARGG